jgi:type VI protein secretion system component VasK
MNNTRVGILIGSGLATGLALTLAARRHRHNRSLLVRTRKQAADLRSRASKFREIATDLIGKSRQEAERQKKGFVHAIDAGRAAYHKVAG